MSSAWETAFTRRSGYGAFPLTQTIRLGAFGGVGAIHFGRRRDVAGHCNDLISCRARIYYDWRGACAIFRASRCGQTETFEAKKRRARRQREMTRDPEGHWR